MHRPGHIDNTGSGTNSMDRRKYLKALAIGATGAALLLDSCTPKSDKDNEHEDNHEEESAPAGKKTATVSWGYISLYHQEEAITIEDAKKFGPPQKEEPRIKIPFFNSNEIKLNQGDVVGFHLMKIGCPARFIIAVNLIDKDHDPTDDRAAMKKRNAEMDVELDKMGYKKEPWQPIAPC